MAVITFILCKVFLKVSSFIPGPLIALAFGYVAAQTFWADKGLLVIADKFGSIPTDFSTITLPLLPETWTAKIVFDLVYFAVAIYTVSAIESLLCSRMADRLANNKGTPFNPN